jgi:phosphoribosylformylglycinamidine synthase
MVQSNTMIGPGSDAAVIRIKGTGKALAMTLDGQGYRVARNPREGAKLAVAEACRNVVCSGAQPMAATNCLNFGNPEHPEVMWQFSEVVDGMAEACDAFETPITGGNVSFYNETFGGDIYPTPVMGIVGLIEDLSLVTASAFRQDGDAIVLLETEDPQTGRVDLTEERELQRLVSSAIRDHLIHSAHDLSEGGLAVAVAECCYSNSQRKAIGADVNVPAKTQICRDLFGDYASRIIVSTVEPDEIRSRAERAGLRATLLGKVGGSRLVLNYEGDRAIDVAIDELETAWRQGLPSLL